MVPLLSCPQEQTGRNHIQVSITLAITVPLALVIPREPAPPNFGPTKPLAVAFPIIPDVRIMDDNLKNLKETSNKLCTRPFASSFAYAQHLPTIDWNQWDACSSGNQNKDPCLLEGNMKAVFYQRQRILNTLVPQRNFCNPPT